MLSTANPKDFENVTFDALSFFFFLMSEFCRAVASPCKECVISLRTLRSVQHEHLTLMLSPSYVQSNGDLFSSKIEQSSVLTDNLYKPLRQIIDSPGVCAIKRQSRDDNAASASKRERKKEEEEEKEEEAEKASEMFERSATPHKSDDRLHDHVQPITSTPRTMIVSTIESLDNVFGMMTR
ncbi:hypothetical protein G5I_04501 [Acromyrmex echinatior]|uniref:Uncharacterized protein n=1 Tax=Acromyrmex echinatior TaxID=103372 RepID=F4WFT5_ACREC|nr:hypothetical protein G5I_04501 [Acromyrmex echinatior]